MDAVRYTIRIDGHLGATMLSAFPTLAPQHRGPQTVLTGLLDHSALYGVLAEIEALGQAGGTAAAAAFLTSDARPPSPDRSCASTAGSSSVEPEQPEQVSRQEKKRVNEMMPAVLPSEQRQLVFGERPVPAPRPGEVCASRWMVGPDGETPASLTIAPAPPRSSLED